MLSAPFSTVVLALNCRKVLILWWAQQDSNLRLPPCEGGTLPLSYAPAEQVGCNATNLESSTAARALPIWQLGGLTQALCIDPALHKALH